MSRSEYTDDYDGDSNWSWIRYRGAVKSAFRGRRGQAFLKEMYAALQAMPDKQLIDHDLVRADGSACAMGAVTIARGKPLVSDGTDYGWVARQIDIAEAMAREIAYENDDCGPNKETPQQRWARMVKWCYWKIHGHVNHERMIRRSEEYFYYYKFGVTE